MHSIPSTRARTVGVTLSWIAAAAVAIAVGTAAVGALGDGIIDDAPDALTSTEVSAALADAPTATATRSPSAPSPPATSSSTPPPASTPADPPPPDGTDPPAETTEPADPPPADPPPAGQQLVTSSAGGTVISECNDGLVTLLSYSPAQGFAVDQVDAGPTDHASVRFEGGDVRVDIDVRCDGNTPVAEVETDAD